MLELQHYRYWVLWKLPSVRFLDYQKVKEAERERGRELFGSEEEPTALATKVGLTTTHRSTSSDILQIMGTKSSGIEAPTNGQTESRSRLSRIKLTDDEKKRLQERIKKATSLQEIIALEKELNEGRLPAGIQGDAMEE